MGSIEESAYIERLHEDIKIACLRLEENGHESLVITVYQDSPVVTGSKNGINFVADRPIFLAEFIQHCSSKRLAIKVENDTETEHREGEAIRLCNQTEAVCNEALNTPVLPSVTENNISQYEYDAGSFDSTLSDGFDSDSQVNDTQISTEEENQVRVEDHSKIKPVLGRTRNLRKRKFQGGNEVTKKFPKVRLSRLKTEDQAEAVVNTAEKSVKSNSIAKPLEPRVATVIETKEKYLKCSICYQYLSSKDQIAEHEEAHKNLTCQFCNKLCRSIQFLEDHIKNYCRYGKCSHCSKEFKSRLELNEHVEKDHEKLLEKKKGKFPCSKCGIVFIFEEHRSEHNQRKPDCKAFLDSVKGTQNKKSMLQREVTYTDAVTGKTKVKSIKELLAKAADDRNKCEVCQKTIERKHSYKRHIYTHSTLRPYICNICFADFTLEEALKKHMARHDARPYYCVKCFLRFDSRARLEYHQSISCKDKQEKPEAPAKSASKLRKRKHNGEKEVCDSCGKEFTQRGNLIRHLREAHGEVKLMECLVCFKTFNSIGKLKRHQRTHMEPKHQCEICGFKTIEPRNLKLHMQTHTGEKSFICDICGKAFRNKYYLDNHHRMHTGERPYKCDFPGCEKAFRNSENLKNHKCTHSTTHGYVCDFCGKAFKVRNRLSHHRLYHIIDYRWPCEYCEEKFKTKNHYKQHIVTTHPDKAEEIEGRTKNKFYRCDTCPKIFAKKEHWAEHTNIHKGLKPWKCRHCGKGFCSKGNMRQHERSHDGIKRMRCKLCSKLYSDINMYKQHMKEKHDIEVPESQSKLSNKSFSRSFAEDEECEEAVKEVIENSMNQNEADMDDSTDSVQAGSSFIKVVVDPNCPNIIRMESDPEQEDL